MLGAQPLSGLSSLINWSNSSSHQRPILEPWGHITTSNNPIPVALATETTEPTALAAGTDVPSKPPVTESISEVIAPVATPTIQTAVPVPEVEAAAPFVIELVAPAPVIPAPVAVEATQPTPTATRKEPQVTEPVVAIPIAAEVVPEKTFKGEPKDVAPAEAASFKQLEPAQAERVVAVTPPSVVENPVIQAQESSQPVRKTFEPEALAEIQKRAVKQSLTESASASSSKKTAQAQPSLNPKPTPKPPIVTPSNVSPPTNRPPVPPQRVAASSMPDWKPTARPNRPTDSGSTGDEYLRQLERLIIELNMELGMRDGESPSQETDQMSLLVQRMIDLNLQNLALKEQLREAASPTL